MQAIKKASLSELADKNNPQPEYHRQFDKSTLKIRIGEILLNALQDPQRPDTWREFERLLRLRWSGPPISAVKTSAATANAHATQAGLAPGRAGTSNWSHARGKINPDEDKAFLGCEVSARVNV